MNFAKNRVRAALGLNESGMAAFFDVTPGAVSQWPEDDPIPESRQWMCKAKRPDLFGTWRIHPTTNKPAPVKSQRKRRKVKP